MANWAFTDYVVEGPHETITKIYEAIKNPDTSEGDEGWEGGVLKALGIQWQPRNPDGSGYYMRGFIQKDSVELDETLSFSAEEAWGATDFHEVLEKNLPDIKVFYQVEECGEEIYATNDKEGKYFSDRYYADCCIDGDYQSEYFCDKEVMYEWLKDITNGRVTDKESVEAFNSDYEDSAAEDENFIYIHEFALVD